MPKVACLNKFKNVLIGIPEISNFPMRDGRTFKIPCIDGLAVNFDFLVKKRVQALIVECCQNISMQQVLVGIPMEFNRDQLEMVVARAMFGFSKVGIRSGLGNCPLYVKGLITGRVQSLIEELKKGGSEEIMTETDTAEKKRAVPWQVSWDKLIDHLVGEKDVVQGGYWEVPKPAALLIELGLFNGNLNAAKMFMNTLTKRGLANRIGGRKYCKWHIYNLPWSKNANGKVVVTEETPAPENSGPPLDLMVSALENVVYPVELRKQLEKFFGGDFEMASLFARECEKRIKRMEKVKRAAELYANFIDGMKSL